MALRKNFNSGLKRDRLNSSRIDGLDERFEFVYCTRAIRRKRVAVANQMEESQVNSPSTTPSKKQLDSNLILEESQLNSPPTTPSRKQLDSSLILEKPNLEALPQDILFRILRCVDHDDLKQLFHVSKMIREATLIAKQQHFAFSTPTSKSAVLRPFSDLEDGRMVDNDAPNAPKQRRWYCKARISQKNLADIAVALFQSPKEKEWRDDEAEI